jgi:heptosyltransferase-2
MSGPGRILVRVPNWVGDALMATPALRALRQAHPRAEIWVCGAAHLGPLLRGGPSVDRFLPAPARGARAFRAFVGQLRAERFDWAVLLADSVRAASGPFAARIPLRVGYARDPLRRMLVTRALEPPREHGRRVPISMIERYLRITRALGCPDAGQSLDLCVDPAARASVRDRLAEAGVGTDEPLVVVTPGASFGASKLWPSEHFAEACDKLHARLGLRPVLAPGPGEEDVARRITERATCEIVDLDAPTTSLAELAALVERARLVLTNDTGPRHMAVALGTPVVALLGPTDPRHTHHLLERQRVLREPVECSPCHRKVCPIDHRCMVRLAPSRVVDAAVELID